MTLGRPRPVEWSARRRDLYMTAHSTRNTDIHAPGGIRTRNPSKRAASDARLSASAIFVIVFIWRNAIQYSLEQYLWRAYRHLSGQLRAFFGTSKFVTLFTRAFYWPVCDSHESSLQLHILLKVQFSSDYVCKVFPSKRYIIFMRNLYYGSC